MRVLYVSKPVQPPWHDGSKNLVRDLAEHVPDVIPTVLTNGDDNGLTDRVLREPVYRAGTFGFSPTLQENARVLLRLLGPPREEVWHFVFAPNPLSSGAAHAAIRAQKLRSPTRRPKVVQTIASTPKQFVRVQKLLFGDVVVAQSQDTFGKLVRAGVPADSLVVIPPCARAPVPPTPERTAALRSSFPKLAERYVVYPGDLEVSSGAKTVLGAASALVSLGFDVVFACRAKTPKARAHEDALRAELPAELHDRVHFAGTVGDLPALLAGAFAVLFPVDDLYGKVDLPLVLLESLSLGVPLVVAKGGPLTEIESALQVRAGESHALVDEVARLAADPTARTQLVERGRAEYQARFTPEVVARAYGDVYRKLVS